MKLKRRLLTKLSAKQRLIASAGIFCFLGIGLIIFINLSNKREAKAVAIGDYRSRASGDWNNIATWEKYNGSSWISATAIPSANDGVIEISNGHAVTITSDITADEVIIDEEA